ERASRARASGSFSRSAANHRFASLLSVSRELWGVSFMSIEAFLHVRARSPLSTGSEEGSLHGAEPTWVGAGLPCRGQEAPQCALPRRLSAIGARCQAARRGNALRRRPVR